MTQLSPPSKIPPVSGPLIYPPLMRRVSISSLIIRPNPLSIPDIFNPKTNSTKTLNKPNILKPVVRVIQRRVKRKERKERKERKKGRKERKERKEGKKGREGGREGRREVVEEGNEGKEEK